MIRIKSILFFIGSPAIFCFSLSRQALSNKHTVAVRRKSNRRKYDRPKHSTPTRRSGNTCRSIIPEPHPTVVRIRHTPGRNDMIRAGNNICRPFRHGNTVFVTAKRPASHRKTEPQNRGEDRPHPAYVFRMAFLYEAGTARSTETRVRKYPDAGITHRADGTTATAAGLSFP